MRRQKNISGLSFGLALISILGRAGFNLVGARSRHHRTLFLGSSPMLAHFLLPVSGLCRNHGHKAIFWFARALFRVVPSPRSQRKLLGFAVSNSPFISERFGWHETETTITQHATFFHCARISFSRHFLDALCGIFVRRSASRAPIKQGHQRFCAAVAMP